MKNATYHKLSNMIYQARELGLFPELETNQETETGINWRDKHTPFIHELLTLRRLANKHHKLAEMDCNGEGVVRGRFYSCSPYHSLKSAASAYLDKDGEKTIFTAESNKVEAKIKGICDRLGLRVEFQGDPRGYTVKVFKGERFLDIQG